MVPDLNWGSRDCGASAASRTHGYPDVYINWATLALPLWPPSYCPSSSLVLSLPISTPAIRLHTVYAAIPARVAGSAFWDCYSCTRLLLEICVLDVGDISILHLQLWFARRRPIPSYNLAVRQRYVPNLVQSSIFTGYNPWPIHIRMSLVGRSLVGLYVLVDDRLYEPIGRYLPLDIVIGQIRCRAQDGGRRRVLTPPRATSHLCLTIRNPLVPQLGARLTVPDSPVFRMGVDLNLAHDLHQRLH
ncbi:hypothetical protein B0H13DRAFT_2365968 [Mycena leptocephala]|nr:hypothetical protein B0H13DRAFT_2365968 [Mycena leptocephala]